VAQTPLARLGPATARSAGLSNCQDEEREELAETTVGTEAEAEVEAGTNVAAAERRGDGEE